MNRPMFQCQVCGREEEREVINRLTAEYPDEAWMICRVEQKGGFVQILACPECATSTHDLILESYKDRIRHGLEPGFH